jgi:AraC-like DNA-binding protein
MVPEAAARLEGHRIFQSGDLEETRKFLQTKNFYFEPLDRGANHFARLNGVYLPGMYFGYVGYTCPVATRPTAARSDYWIQFPIQGRIAVDIGRQQFVGDAEHALMLSPTQENMIRSNAETGRLNVSLTHAALACQLSALLNEPVAKALEFAPLLSVVEGYGRTLAQYVRLAVSELEKPDSIMWTPIAMAQIEEFIMTVLLLAHPHNYSHALSRLKSGGGPRDVRRAIDYIEANCQSPITLRDLVVVSGVAGRTLLKHFHDYMGTTPMRYLAKVRFEKARAALRCPEPGASVAEIAEAWGLGHLGRFSVEYRRRFGESPSETLRNTGGWKTTVHRIPGRRSPSLNRDWSSSIPLHLDDRN